MSNKLVRENINEGLDIGRTKRLKDHVQKRVWFWESQIEGYEDGELEYNEEKRKSAEDKLTVYTEIMDLMNWDF